MIHGPDPTHLHRIVTLSGLALGCFLVGAMGWQWTWSRRYGLILMLMGGVFLGAAGLFAFDRV